MPPSSQDEDDTEDRLQQDLVTLMQSRSASSRSRQTLDPTDIDTDATTAAASKDSNNDNNIIINDGFIRGDEPSMDLNLYNAAPVVSGVLITGFSLFLTFYGYYAGITGTDPIFQQYPTPAAPDVVQVI